MAGIPLFSCRFPRLWLPFFCVRHRVVFRPHGRKKKLEPFFGPTSHFLAQKRFFSAKNGVLRRVLRSPRGFFGSQFSMPALSKKGNSRHANPPGVGAAYRNTPTTQTQRVRYRQLPGGFSSGCVMELGGRGGLCLKNAELTHELTQSPRRAHARAHAELTQSARRAHAELTAACTAEKPNFVRTWAVHRTGGVEWWCSAP